MRKLFLLVLITTALLAFTMVPAQAAETIISTDILTDVVGLFNVEYEMAMGDNLSLFVDGGFGSQLGVSIWQIGAGANYYILDKACQGLYVGGGLGLVGGGAGGISITLPYFMVNVGYKLVLGEKFVIDPYFGLFGGVGVKLGYALQ